MYILYSKLLELSKFFHAAYETPYIAQARINLSRDDALIQTSNVILARCRSRASFIEKIDYFIFPLSNASDVISRRMLQFSMLQVTKTARVHLRFRRHG